MYMHFKHERMPDETNHTWCKYTPRFFRVVGYPMDHFYLICGESTQSALGQENFIPYANLTYLRQNKITAISQTIFSDAFLRMACFVF